MKKTFFFLFVFVIYFPTYLPAQFFNSNQNDQGPYDPTEDLLQAFSSNCSSFGNVTNQAVQDSKTIFKVIQSIRDDNSCQGLSAALSSFSHLDNQIRVLISDDRSENQILNTEKSVQDLTYLALNESDPLIRNFYLNQLALDKINLNLITNFDSQVRQEKVYQGIAALANYMDNIFPMLSTNSECLTSRPGLGIQISGHLLEVASFWASYPLSPIIFSIGRMFNGLAKHIRNAPYNKQLRKLASSRMGAALGCTIESLSNNLCKMRDLKRIVNYSAQQISSETNENNEFWSGINILDRDIDIFNIWVNRLFVGAPPSTVYMAQSKNEGQLFQTTFISVNTMIEGILAEARRKQTQLSNQQDIIANVRATINLIIAELSKVINFGETQFFHSTGINPNSPYAAFFSKDPQCGPFDFLYTGEITGQRDPNVRGCILYTNDSDVPTLEELSLRVEEIKRGSEENVLVELSLNKENDLFSVFQITEVGQGNQENVFRFLTKSLNYISGLKNKYKSQISPYTEMNIQDLETRLLTSLNTLNTRCPEDGQSLRNTSQRDINQNLNTCLLKKASQLSSILLPQQDLFFIEKKLKLIIEWDINKRIENNELSRENLEDTLKVTITGTLQPLITYQMSQLDDVNIQIANSQHLITDSLISISETFEKSLIEKLEDLDKKSNQSFYSDYLDVYCTQLISVPFDLTQLKKLNKTMRTICKNRGWKTVYPKISNDSSFNIDFLKTINKNFDNRSCEFFDKKRRARIYSRQLD